MKVSFINSWSVEVRHKSLQQHKRTSLQRDHLKNRAVFCYGSQRICFLSLQILIWEKMESEMKSNVSSIWRSKMPEGLDLEISNHPLTMKSVANLIIALERMKSSSRSELLLSTEFGDENLLNIMLENVVEGNGTEKTF